MTYEIERGYPIPPKPYSSGRNVKYPLGRMEIGDSFPFTKSEYRKIATASSNYGRRHDMKFATRAVMPPDGTYRCWRIA